MLTLRGAYWISLALMFMLPTGALRAASYRPVADRRHSADALFTNDAAIRHLQIQIAPRDLETLRRFSFRSREEHRRTNVAAMVREGSNVWTNVAVHIKGALGSFRPIDSKPSLTLNFEKWARGQTFHGLQKISLNNSVQDPSYLTEKICREIYNAAGVPTPRSDFATVELNGRKLGLFVLTEGWNKQFLRRHFNDVSGNLYEPGLSRDVTGTWAEDIGSGSTNHGALQAAAAAVRISSHSQRMARLREAVDLDRFIRMTALDCLMWNWDGYAINRNNYRMFHDLESDRLVFLPHGVDQMFWKPNGPIMAGRSGIVAKALLETEEGRDMYLQQLPEIRRAVFDLKAITNRLAAQAARVRPVLAREGLAVAGQFDSSMQILRNRILARARDVDEQLEGVKDLVRLARDESVALTNWSARRYFGKLILDRTAEPEGMHIQANGETSFGAWVTTVWLEEGRYVLEGRVRTSGVEGALRNEPGGAGFRVWSQRKDTKGASWGWFPYSSSRDPQLGGIIPVVTNSIEMRLTGTNEWKTISHEFELRHPLADLQIQCVLQALAGEAWFDPASLRLRRTALTVSRSARD